MRRASAAADYALLRKKKQIPHPSRKRRGLVRDDTLDGRRGCVARAGVSVSVSVAGSVAVAISTSVAEAGAGIILVAAIATASAVAAGAAVATRTTRTAASRITGLTSASSGAASTRAAATTASASAAAAGAGDRAGGGSQTLARRAAVGPGSSNDHQGEQNKGESVLDSVRPSLRTPTTRGRMAHVSTFGLASVPLG